MGQAHYDRQRALGFSDRLIRIERDSWIMVAALAPESIPRWVAAKSAALDDPEFVRLYLACDQALDWAADDPRLPGLAEAIAAWDAGHPATAASPREPPPCWPPTPSSPPPPGHACWNR
ncbi:hypothetical protein [Thermoactinospora rubra]|uniref:hypothetical protein n=1 Tax=Thermoactinospora rubra TaxID=1088767 RepID=UPI000A0F48F7|nr:hypothetical protein [Thermoactinospora rubra]